MREAFIAFSPTMLTRFDNSSTGQRRLDIASSRVAQLPAGAKGGSEMFEMGRIAASRWGAAWAIGANFTRLLAARETGCLCFQGSRAKQSVREALREDRRPPIHAKRSRDHGARYASTIQRAASTQRIDARRDGSSSGRRREMALLIDLPEDLTLRCSQVTRIFLVSFKSRT